jgi:hypothetical protein
MIVPGREPGGGGVRKTLRCKPAARPGTPLVPAGTGKEGKGEEQLEVDRRSYRVRADFP